MGGADGVLRPLQELRAALPDRLDLFQVEPTSLMASPARCLELQQALALLKGASDAEVKRVGGAYGVLRPLKQLRAALPHRLDLFQVEHTPDLLPPSPTLASLPVPAAPLHDDKLATLAAHECPARVRGVAQP